jgi:hypothetical protein
MLKTGDQPKATISDLFLRDLDKAVVSWFSTDFPVNFEGKKTPVIYVSQERWALQQKQRGYRDENGVLILPIITVRRLDAGQLLERYVYKNDDTRIYIKRIMAKDKGDSDQLIPWDPAGSDTPIYEIITAEFPTFVKLKYNITLYTSYLSQANQLQENVWKKFDSGRSYFKYNDFFVFAQIDGSSDQSNLDDFTDQQRIIKYEYNFSMDAPLIDKHDIKIFRTVTKPTITCFEL